MTCPKCGNKSVFYQYQNDDISQDYNNITKYWECSACGEEFPVYYST